MSLSKKRQIIQEMKADYPVAILCQTLDCSRSSFYHHPTPVDETKLHKAVQEVIVEFPTYGYRRVTKQLHRSGLVVNHKPVRKMLKRLGLQQVVRRRECRTTNSLHEFPRYPNLVINLNIVQPDQVWVCDITYIRLDKDFIYLAVVLDVFTRCIRGWALSRNIDQELTLDALQSALNHGCPQIHHSDQGVQYAATGYVKLLQKYGVKISMAQIGHAEQNGYAERLMRTIKEEEVYLAEYEDFIDAKRQIGRFLDHVYMHKRIHSAIGYLTPVEFEHQWKLNQLKC